MYKIYQQGALLEGAVCHPDGQVYNGNQRVKDAYPFLETGLRDHKDQLLTEGDVVLYKGPQYTNNPLLMIIIKGPSGEFRLESTSLGMVLYYNLQHIEKIDHIMLNPKQYATIDRLAVDFDDFLDNVLWRHKKVVSHG